MKFKTTAEIYTALLNGEKITSVPSVASITPEYYVCLVHGALTDNEGRGADYNFCRPNDWHIWQEPVKEWEPNRCGTPFTLGTVWRSSDSIAVKDFKAWRSAIKLESFVREFAPDFVPVWGDKYSFLIHTVDTWQCWDDTHKQVGRVPFPLDGDLAHKACEMLNNGTLKL